MDFEPCLKEGPLPWSLLNVKSLAAKLKNRTGPSRLNTANSTRAKNGAVTNSKMADGTLLVSPSWAGGSNLCDGEEKGKSNKLLSWQEHPVYALRNTMALRQDVAMWLQKTACKNNQLWISNRNIHSSIVFSVFWTQRLLLPRRMTVNCMLHVMVFLLFT